MSFEKKIKISNQLSELEKLFLFTQELQEKLELAPDVVFNLNLSLEEAMTNVILYAYPNGTGYIELGVNATEDNLLFTLQDQGIPFNPLTEAPEADITSPAEEREIGGLGIFLIRQLMDLVEYERSGESNILRMTKQIK
ncbi:MAG: ATP-binding protein [Bacteroidaceae bacterium]|nr:ATP-binding protein [Bacteroidaceae bacterium]